VTRTALADFDSSAGLVQALSAVSADRAFRHLGHAPPVGLLARALGQLPDRWAIRAFALGGAAQAVPPSALPRVSAERFARWVTERYPSRPTGIVFVGSSNGAVMHLAAALRAPWLPQTFLVPVRRHAAADDARADLHLARPQIKQLLAREPDLMVHQMHDPNQDRAMLTRMGYLRFKLGALPPAYRRFIGEVLPPGGLIVVVDCALRWPVVRLGARHVFQPGAVGGLNPEDYLTRWDYPAPDEDAPEAEWGFAAELLADVQRFARQAGHRVLRLGLPHPDAAAPFAAEAHRAWYTATGHDADRLLVETFIAVEPFWALATRTVPFWVTFPTAPSLAEAARYIGDGTRWREIAMTLFAHGTHSAGLASAPQWRRVAERARERGWLAGVRTERWPVDFGALDRYARALHLDRHAALLPPVPMPWTVVQNAAAGEPRVELEPAA
jgi:hypothetical protein